MGKGFEDNNIDVDIGLEEEETFLNKDLDSDDDFDTYGETDPKKKKKIIIIVAIIIILLLLLLTFMGVDKIIDTIKRKTADKSTVINYYTTAAYKSNTGNIVKWYCLYDRNTGEYETFIDDSDTGDYQQIYPASGIWDSTIKVVNPTVEMYFIDNGDMTGQYIAVIKNSTYPKEEITFQKVIYNDNIIVTVGVLKDKNVIVSQDVSVKDEDRVIVKKI